MPSIPDLVLGISRATAVSRSSFVRDAQAIFNSLCPATSSLVFLPAFEKSRLLPGGQRAVDRVVTLPLSSGPPMVALATPAWAASRNLSWCRLKDVAGSLRYPLAAHALARVRSLLPSGTRELRLALTDTCSDHSSGANPSTSSARQCCSSSYIHPSRCSLRPHSTWKEAVAFCQAAEALLRQHLLQDQSDSKEAEYLRSFADRICPGKEGEVPPTFMRDGNLPSFSDPSLVSVPFCVRVHPPRTSSLAPPRPQPAPPSDFTPSSLKDLLLPSWYSKLEAWVCDFGDWLCDLVDASVKDPESLAVTQVLKRRPEPFVVPQSGFVQGARGIIWDLRGASPVPLDFSRPPDTHLDLSVVRGWRSSWPDYPDQEIFSHLLHDARFKADVSPVIIL